MRFHRRIRIAFGLSLLVHALIVAFPIRERMRPARPPGLETEGPLIVHLNEPIAQPPETTPLTEPVAPPVLAPRPPVPRRELVARERKAAVPMPMPAPEPAPPVDMLAMINARRERRRAVEAAAAREQAPSPEEAPGDIALANITRNLQTLSDTEGVGGIFQILRKGTRTAEFAFNGWRPDTRRRWREVIEVDAGSQGDIEQAIVRRMIELIRSHYSGDFRWESHRLGRVVVLSARPADNQMLEDFLIREFFGTPTLNRGR